MIYIHKTAEPNSLTEYKKQSGAYYDGFKNKDDIRRKLLEEQGYLCAYCMRRIPNVDLCTIEHYKSQQLCTPSEALDYNNMLGVCTIDRNQRKQFQTCDSHRGSTPLTVNPLNEKSLCQIYYEEQTGKIHSMNKSIDFDLDNTLNLNCTESRLPAIAKQVWKLLRLFSVNKKRMELGIQSFCLNSGKYIAIETIAGNTENT